MLTRTMASWGTAVLLAAGLAVLPQSTALAAGGPGGTGAFGLVQCGQASTASCEATAGSPATSMAGGAPAASSRPGGAAGCAGTASRQFGCVPPGCKVSVATLVCPLTRPALARAGGRLPVGAMAQFARRYLLLPPPVIVSSPPPDVLQLAGLPVWLWVNQAVWAPRSATAAVPGERVTVTAAPVAVTWRMGDGSVVVCHGPGTPYASRYSPASASPDCGHTYRRSSAGQPGRTYHVRATITWAVTWQATGGTGGALPPLHSTAAAALRVADSQTVNIAGRSR